MTTPSLIRNRVRSSSRNDKQFLFLASEDLLSQMRNTAYSHDISLSAFIRESIRRNISRYQERLQ